MEGFGSFALGVGAALVAASAGPAIGRRLRPAVRGTLKQVILLGEGVRVRVAQVQEDLEDLAAEARAEAQAARQAPPNATSSSNGAEHRPGQP
jgi:hypothetical protein